MTRQLDRRVRAGPEAAGQAPGSASGELGCFDSSRPPAATAAPVTRDLPAVYWDYSRSIWAGQVRCGVSGVWRVALRRLVLAPVE